jgi:hypothetical protein
MVSVLGLVLSVPGPPSAFAPVARATWGMLVTVSVSTVISCVEMSCLDFSCFEVMPLDVAETRDGGGTDVGRRSRFVLPASLPLSVVGIPDLTLRVRWSLTALSDWFSSFSLTWDNRWASLVGLGELGRLTS